MLCYGTRPEGETAPILTFPRMRGKEATIDLPNQFASR